jgi:very-short-patch-repair endonuclease
MTPAERKLWTRQCANHLEWFHFRRQQIIDPYIVDFYYHQAALVIEVDGDIHLDQQDYDNLRDQALQSMGLRVVRFSNSEVIQNIDGVLQEILRICRITPFKKQDQEEV